MIKNLISQELEMMGLFPDEFLDVDEYLEYLRDTNVEEENIDKFVGTLITTNTLSEKLIIEISKLLISEKIDSDPESIIKKFRSIVQALGEECNVYELQMSTTYDIKSHIHKWAVSLQEDIISINQELMEEFKILLHEIVYTTDANAYNFMTKLISYYERFGLALEFIKQ